jgi:4-hydroxy-4-methyl-2-oxoglutarate aldolase
MSTPSGTRISRVRHRALPLALTAVCALAALAAGQQSAAPPAPAAAITPAAGDPLVEGFRLVEVASVADAMEQLYGQRGYMSHQMRPLSPVKFAGPAVTVRLTREEHKEGPPASQGMLDVIDGAAPGSVYVMVLEGGKDAGGFTGNSADYAGIGGLMATAMKYRGFAGAVIDASVRDTPQIRKLQFPVFSRGVSPATTINHFRVSGVNVPVTCAGVPVSPGDIVSADEDGIVAIPRGRAADILKRSQQLDDTEHRMYPFIEKFRSISIAVKEFGRI